MRWIDPPSGWRYGFPLPFDPKPGQHIDEWLVQNGYPQGAIDEWQPAGVPCRIWGKHEIDPVRVLEAKVLSRLRFLVGDPEQANVWYHTQAISALGQRTADAIVRGGDGENLLSLLQQITHDSAA